MRTLPELKRVILSSLDTYSLPVIIRDVSVVGDYIGRYAPLVDPTFAGFGYSEVNDGYHWLRITATDNQPTHTTVQLKKYQQDNFFSVALTPQHLRAVDRSYQTSSNEPFEERPIVISSEFEEAVVLLDLPGASLSSHLRAHPEPYASTNWDSVRRSVLSHRALPDVPANRLHREYWHAYIEAKKACHNHPPVASLPGDLNPIPESVLSSPPVSPLQHTTIVPHQNRIVSSLATVQAQEAGRKAEVAVLQKFLARETEKNAALEAQLQKAQEEIADLKASKALASPVRKKR